MKKLLLSALLVAGAASYATAEEVVVFSEDFEWLAPWSAVGGSKGPAGDTVGKNNSDEYCPQLSTSKIEGVSTWDTLLEKGYSFISVKDPSKDKDRPANQNVYLQTNYLKFGLTGYQSGIILPSMEVPAGETATLSFSFCTIRQGSGVFDKTELVAIVANGEEEVQYPIDLVYLEDGADYAWNTVSVELTGATINADTKITVRNADSQWPDPSVKRWCMDNIKVTYDNAGGDTPEPGEGRVFYEDNFAWLAPWAEADQLGDPVGTDDINAKTVAVKETSSIDGYTVFQYMMGSSLNPEFFVEGHPGYETRLYPNSGDYTTVQAAKDYFRIGLPGTTGGLRARKFAVPEDAEGFYLIFEWCPVKNANGEYDDAELELTSRSSNAIVPSIKHNMQTGEPYRWITEVVDLFEYNFTPMASFNPVLQNISSQCVSGGVCAANANWYLGSLRYCESINSGVNNIAVEDNANAPVEYFNLQGVRVANPENGLYIRRQGNKATKILVR